MSAPPEFERLARVDLSAIRGESAWDAHLAALRPWLLDADGDVRARALERLAMGVLAAERGSVVVARNEGVAIAHDPPSRLAWLLDAIEAAHAVHADMIPAFLGELRYKGDPPFDTLLIPWLRRLAAAPPAGVDPDMAAGTILLLEPAVDEDDPQAVQRLVALLDHASDYVRACAAKRLADVDGGCMDAAAVFALIRQTELARPGVAGPFWSAWQFHAEHAPVEPVAWMMDIIENRAGPEPLGMPFNGIDFHLHEIADRSPETVLRLLKVGRTDIAIETATEARRAVAGMEEALLLLADDADGSIRRRAQMHLAMYYSVLHPEAQASGAIRRHDGWSDDAEVTSFRYGEENRLWFVVLTPRAADAPFTDAAAWALIDRLLPPASRGPLVRHHLAFDDAGPPEPHRLGDDLLHRYAAGEEARLTGDVDARTWTRIEVAGWKLGAAWAPFDPP
jgi:hypothetical protein